MVRSTNRAFARTELLVLVCVVVSLATLIIPAIQSARTAAQLSECSNNLKQIGLGLHNYHDTNASLPAGWMSSHPAGSDALVS